MKKGWKALFQPLMPTAIMVLREFYSILAALVLKKVRVRGVLVDISAKSINEFYNLDLVNPKSYVISRKRGVYICTPMCGSARVASSNIVYLGYRY